MSVYIVQARDAVKIGKSKDVDQRIMRDVRAAGGVGSVFTAAGSDRVGAVVSATVTGHRARYGHGPVGRAIVPPPSPTQERVDYGTPCSKCGWIMLERDEGRCYRCGIEGFSVLGSVMSFRPRGKA